MDGLYDNDIDFATVVASGNVPFWFSQGHIRDDLAKVQQAGHEAQQLDAASPPAAKSIKFLSAIEKPEIGMCTYTSVYGLDGTTMRLTGVITSIDEEPSAEDLSRSDSLFWGLLSKHTMAASFNAKTPADKKAFISNFLGSVHGQRVTSIAMLSEEQGGQEACHHLLPRGSIVEIVHKLNDTMYYPWTVDSFCVLNQPASAASEYDPVSLYFNGFDQEATSTALNWQPKPLSSTTTLMNDASMSLIGDTCSSNHQDCDDSVCSKQHFY